MRCSWGLLLATALLASCAVPPRAVYVGGSPYGEGAVGIGSNASGEACTQQPLAGGGAVDIFCGKWLQPSGSVARLGAGSPDTLTSLATSGTWRTSLDQSVTCEPPRAGAILSGQPAEILLCRRKVGGWPVVAMLASVDGTVYSAHGILPVAAVLERAIAVMSGRATPDSAGSLPRSGAEALVASRLAAQAFSAGDVSEYDQLMAAGLKANQAESFVAAEQAYRAALKLQEKALGQGNPNAAVPLMRLALQVSNQQRFPEADGLFASAAQLAPTASDPLAKAELLHDRALNMANQRRWEEALSLLRRAEAAYAANVPKEALSASPTPRSDSLAPLISNSVPILDPAQQSALIGVIETRRYEAIALGALGRNADARAVIDSATSLAAARNLRQPVLSARLSRTMAGTAHASGATHSALASYEQSVSSFTEALPGSRPVAETNLLRAAELAAVGDPGQALTFCREAVTLLRELELGTRIELLEPCLRVYLSQATGANGQKLLAEMFEASQLAQEGITSQQIALAAARLAASTKDPRVGEAIRRRQDAGLRLAELDRARDLRALKERGEQTDLNLSGLPSSAELEKETAQARAILADADAALQTAAPEYGQLVQQVVPSADVLRSLAPSEVFASIILAPEGCWTFVLRDGKIGVSRSAIGASAMSDLVKRLRAGLAEGRNGPARFDTDAAHAVYAATLGGQDSAFTGADSLTVAPAGPLLALPFGVLLTGAGQPDALANAPWLIRRLAIAHVPSAANFVALRKIVAGSRATEPWFGMGDFRPVTLAQAERTFPTEGCARSAQLFAGLPPLPLTRRELDAARQLLGGLSRDELLGAAFTARAVGQVPLRNYEVLHFATHALLPTDIKCQDEPAVVTSAPAGAKDASGALLSAADVTGIKLDADVVILSACNTAGPGQATAGESLSGLARSFFYAGARSMMVTHWSVNDQTTAFLVADTLKHLRSGDTTGSASSLRKAQLDMLDEAGKTLPAVLAHPYFWGPFALIGEGRSTIRTGGTDPSFLFPARSTD